MADMENTVPQWRELCEEIITQRLRQLRELTKAQQPTQFEYTNLRGALLDKEREVAKRAAPTTLAKLVGTLGVFGALIFSIGVPVFFLAASKTAEWKEPCAFWFSVISIAIGVFFASAAMLTCVVACSRGSK